MTNDNIIYSSHTRTKEVSIHRQPTNSAKAHTQQNANHSPDRSTTQRRPQHVIEEALVEALAQEHFNYISEGGEAGNDYSPAIMGQQRRRRRRRPLSEPRGGVWGFLLSPRTAMSVVTIVATAVAARHLRDFLVDFVKEAFAPSSDAGGVGGGGGERVDVKR